MTVESGSLSFLSMNFSQIKQKSIYFFTYLILLLYCKYLIFHTVLEKVLTSSNLRFMGDSEEFSGIPSSHTCLSIVYLVFLITL